jgi:hypothetical protein
LFAPVRRHSVPCLCRAKRKTRRIGRIRRQHSLQAERGTAHWEGDIFVNDYEELVDGKMTKWRDSFIHITPTSHTLVAAMDTGNGAMKTFITTTSTRR